MLVTALTATLPLLLDINALLAVKSSVSIVVAAPVIVGIVSNCVCILLVTPSRKSNSVEVTPVACKASR